MRYNDIVFEAHRCGHLLRFYNLWLFYKHSCQGTIARTTHLSRPMQFTCLPNNLL